MLAGRLLQRNNQRPRLRALLIPFFAVALICLLYGLVPIHRRPSPIPAPKVYERPLVKEHIDRPTSHNASNGGRWYIPESWLQLTEHSIDPLISNPRPTNILDAAQLALELSLRDHRYMNNSGIPLIVHQTWKTPDSSSWPDVVKDSVEGWLEAATGHSGPRAPDMAYIFWADEGIEQFITRYEPQLWNAFDGLPYSVEKADAFRVAVLKWFGGVYSDVDTRLLRHPYDWIYSEDLRDWTDPDSNHTFFAKDRSHARYSAPPTAPQSYEEMIVQHKTFARNVGAIFGIEADTPPESDDYWRMGYTYPVQITNWALAMVPHHPTASEFLEQMVSDMIGMNSTLLSRIDPLDLTGPPALTKAIKSYSESSTAHFRWNGLSGIHDSPGGRGKIIAGDILILPITGFSPGRGRFHNMGSQPLSNHNARLFHAAAGSWRHASLQVQMGKMCRTLLGRCRNWSKIP